MLLVLAGERGVGKTHVAKYLHEKYGFKIARSLPSLKPRTHLKQIAAPKPRAGRTVVDTSRALHRDSRMESGRRLAGHVELLGGLVIEVDPEALSGVRVVLPNGVRNDWHARLRRTIDFLMASMGVQPSVAKKAKAVKRAKAARC